MPRRIRPRKIIAPPRFKGYRPYGRHGNQMQAIELFFEEYEALKLADYELMNHEEASLQMGVSRATFARIYETARRKIAKALVESREIVATVGNSTLDDSWHVCPQCHARFTVTASASAEICPLCGHRMNEHSIGESR